MPRSARVAIIAASTISTCSSRCRVGAHRFGADLLGGLAEAGGHGLQCAVTDRVEAGLQAGLRAGDHVVTHLGSREVGVPRRVSVGIDRPQARGVRADRPVGEQVAGRADRAQLAGPFDAAELAPVADHVRAGLARGQREHGPEVLLAGDVRPAQLVQAADAQRRGAGPGGLLRGPALRRRHGLAGHPSYDVVCLGREVPAVGEPLRVAHLGDGGEQCRGDDGGVHVDATEVDDPAVGRPVELLAASVAGARARWSRPSRGRAPTRPRCARQNASTRCRHSARSAQPTRSRPARARPVEVAWTWASTNAGRDQPALEIDGRVDAVHEPVSRVLRRRASRLCRRRRPSRSLRATTR